MNCRIMPPGGWSVSVHLELMKCINAVVDTIDTKRLVDNSAGCCNGMSSQFGLYVLHQHQHQQMDCMRLKP